MGLKGRQLAQTKCSFAEQSLSRARRLGNGRVRVAKLRYGLRTRRLSAGFHQSMSTSISSPEAQNTTVALEAEKGHGAERSNYGQILKSSALVGGSQALNIAIGIVRT